MFLHTFRSSKVFSQIKTHRTNLQFRLLLLPLLSSLAKTLISSLPIFFPDSIIFSSEFVPSYSIALSLSLASRLEKIKTCRFLSCVGGEAIVSIERLHLRDACFLRLDQQSPFRVRVLVSSLSLSLSPFHTLCRLASAVSFIR